MVIAPLSRKVLRDLWRLRAQVLAIALVLAAGVATAILGSGAQDSLTQTRDRYYAQNRFADVFADLTRAPLALLPEAEALDGVLSAEARIVKTARPELPGAAPATLMMVSLPGTGGLNLLHLRQGRLPDPQSDREVVLSEEFAAAHRLSPGAPLSLVMNGRRMEVTVTGTAISPEFIYALGPGEMMPDPARFGIAWMPRAPLAAAWDLDGAFSNLVLRLAPGASAERVIEALDPLLARYGGTGAIARRDQTSHAFLDAELTQLGAMARVLPPIFLAVAAMLVHITMSRLVALEREQIGLLKAIGYSRRAIAWHYLEFVLLIAVLGIALGFAAGAWLGAGMARLYAEFFSFPYLVFSRSPAIYGLAALVALAAATGGALQAALKVSALPPAVAMAPPAPPAYRRSLGALSDRLALPQSLRMVTRHLLHWPLRTAAAILGLAMAVAILVASLWTFGSLEQLIAVTFHLGERQDVRVAFAAAEPPAALQEIRRLPGVMAAEPWRSIAARLENGPHAKRVAVEGRPAGPQLSRVLSPDLEPMAMPERGLILSEALADALDLRRGDLVTVAFLEGRRNEATLPVSGISVGYVGLGASMELDALNRAAGDGDRISGAALLVDPAAMDEFLAAARAAPGTGTIAVKNLVLARFRATLAENITVMVSVYVGLAAIIAAGVVYNFARIALSEQGRELASLRVLGFTNAEVSAMLFAELGLVTLAAQPLGWLIGHGMAAAMAASFASDLYRVPFLVGRDVYATASLAVCAAAILSALAIAGRIRRLDIVGVLKTRE
ncbi:FtsX-like permease family protein [Mangrovicoccus sp. HB161399]|uniref:ABC transporter permease n=1 Tax=Mangrovicoccus sp. HB161399 TaxID=2720392 RepID=UPI001555D224|nr:FtsX-like permease family protein [Mangrovicoccus sp. HB161399]